MSGVTPEEETFLYRISGPDGLLYVGMTCRVPDRIAQHRKEKSWWSQVRNITVEPFPNREGAAEAEARAIATENPAYNIVKPQPPRQSSPPRRSCWMETVMAREATAVEARNLGVVFRAAVLAVERVLHDAKGNVKEYGTSLYPEEYELRYEGYLTPESRAIYASLFF